MLVSMQVNLLNGWSNNPPVIHEIEKDQKVAQIALLLSHQFGNCTVRVTYPSKRALASISDVSDYVSKLSGTYFQSNEPNNQPELTDYLNRLVN